MDEEKLIVLVSGYKELYDFSDKNYSNQERKNNCWKEISEHMRQPVSACKERWSRLRDNYRKALKFRKGKSGDAAVKTKPYKFEVEMSFLKKYLPDREQKTNVTEPSTSTSAVNSPIPSEDGEDDRMGDPENLSDLEPLTPVSTTSSNNTIFRTTPTAAPRSAPKRKKVHPENTQPTSVACVLEKYLQSTTATNSGGNSLKQFFLAMSETALSFPPEVQIDVKGKIFNIMQEAEVKCLQSKNTTQFDNAHSTHCNQTVYPQLQYTQHSQDIQHSYPKHMQSLGTQPNMPHLNLRHTPRSQNTPPPLHPQNTLSSQPHPYSQDIQLSYTEVMPPLGTQPNITYLNSQQHSKDTAQHSHPQNTLALQAHIQNMQPFPLQDVQPTSPRSTSVVGSPQLPSDNEPHM